MEFFVGWIFREIISILVCLVILAILSATITFVFFSTENSIAHSLIVYKLIVYSFFGVFFSYAVEHAIGTFNIS